VHGASIPEKLSLSAFLGESRAVAAIEFAFVLPLFLIAYLGVVETTLAIETRKKVDRIGSQVADLVTQQKTTTKAKLDAILTIADSLIQPYRRSAPTITITAIQVDNLYRQRAVWSRTRNADGTAGIGQPYNTPVTTLGRTPRQNLFTVGNFVIQVSTSLTYYPLMTWSPDAKQALGISGAFYFLNFESTYVFRPRSGLAIGCSDCMS
jgi:Flp pilus assembly protein TadG